MTKLNEKGLKLARNRSKIRIDGELWQQTTEGGYSELIASGKRKVAKFTSDTLKDVLYFREVEDYNYD